MLLIQTAGVNMSKKLNWLVNHVPLGALVLQPWLSKHEISYSLAQKYAQNGWLHKLGSGVYYRPDGNSDRTPGWPEAVYALQQQLEMPVHLAGLSSLAEQGLAHYLQFRTTDVWLGITAQQKAPQWLTRFTELQWLYCRNSKMSGFQEKDFSIVTVNGQQLRASCAELAAYEMVDAIGKHISFEHAAELFQGLVQLSPRKVQSILSRSQAVATNRIFLFLGHYYQHSWVNLLSESEINLGVGKRQVVVGGHLDPGYQITVPAAMGGKGM